MRKSLLRWSLLFLVPGTLLYILVIIYPVVTMFKYSLTNWQGGDTSDFIGIKNYLKLWYDPVFLQSIAHTFLLMLGALIIQIPLGFLLAIILYRRPFGYRIFRSVYFIPLVLSTVIIGTLWLQIYEPQHGLLNTLLDGLGLHALTQPWLGNVHTSLASIIVVVGWQYVGLYMVIFLSALQTIPPTLFEAASIDGAKGWMREIYITVPLLLDTFKLSVILVVTGSVQYFNLIWLMTAGGPANSTSVMASYMFLHAFQSSEFGYASAAAGVMLILSLFLALVLQRVFKREVIELG